MRGLSVSSPSQFISKAIRYEDAWGGSDVTHPDASKHARDPRNPVGRGFTVHESLQHKLAHSIEYPGAAANEAGPAGFGAIDRHWQPRIVHAGTYDEHWAERKRPLLPDNYDPRFELCSPHDQRTTEYINGGELIELTNMSERGLLRFSLPKIYLTFSTKLRERREEHRGRLVTIIIEPDESRLALVWQTSLKVDARSVEHLEVTTIAEKPYLS